MPIARPLLKYGRLKTMLAQCPCGRLPRAARFDSGAVG